MTDLPRFIVIRTYFGPMLVPVGEIRRAIQTPNGSGSVVTFTDGNEQIVPASVQEIADALGGVGVPVVGTFGCFEVKS